MEKKRWSLIFIGLCLIFAFSVSSVEAQDIDPCDRDDDGFVKDTKKCLEQNPTLPIDCNDNNRDLTDNCDESGDGGGKLEICHFSPNRMHCEGEGGLLRTIQINKLQIHLDHGDCVNLVGEMDQYNFDEDCSGHCIAEDPAGDNHDCFDLNHLTE